MTRPIVLVVLGRYLPGFKAGGPVRSIYNLIEQLAHEFDFRVVAYDRDTGDTSAYPGIDRSGWNQVGEARVRYLSPGASAVPELLRLIRAEPWDLLYLNTFFDPHLALAPLSMRRLGLIPDRPVLLAPRGQLAAGAMTIGSGRKRAIQRMVRGLGYARGLQWHATAPDEADEIRAAMGPDVRVHLARNIPAATERPMPLAAKEPGELRLVFVSRISPKKNLAWALDQLPGMSGRIRFDIHGPTEDAGYAADCRRIAGSLPPNVKVEFHGPLPPARVPEAFRGAHLFFFPTLGENFGHVILESMLAGCPVLISDRTPWRGLAPAHAGWDLPLDQPSLFRAVLAECVAMPATQWATWSEGARAFGLARAALPEAVAEHRTMFHAALARGPATAVPPSLSTTA